MGYSLQLRQQDTANGACSILQLVITSTGSSLNLRALMLVDGKPDQISALASIKGLKPHMLEWAPSCLVRFLHEQNMCKGG